MSSKFFNNQNLSLINKFHGIATSMPNFDIFHAVVGYFRSSGYFRLREELGNVQEIKILTGINIDNIFKHQQSQNILFSADKRTILEEWAKVFLKEVADAEYKKEVDESMLTFLKDIDSGRLQMRINKDHNLHAKFYLCLPNNHSENSDGWVIMGSSNISEQGLGLTEPPRYELNVAMKDYDDVKYCEDEFLRLWEEAVPITMDDIIETVGPTHLPTSKAPTTPYEIYMRLLIDHFGDQIEDEYVPQLPDNYDDLTYQKDAVIQAYNIMLRHNGCFVADVVGLGKTVIAAMMAQRFIEENGSASRILVVCPPAIMGNWINTFDDFRIRKKYSTIVSSGNLHKVVEGDPYNVPEYYDLVIIDEAHNFRNDTTGGYALLQQITKSRRDNGGRIGGPKKVLLLSATPLNNTPEDIKNQLLLFQDAARSTLEGVGNIDITFATWIKKYKEIMSHRKEISAEELSKTVDGINQEIRQKILQQVMVRRTRSNIQHLPKYAAEISFPKLLDPQEYEYKMSDNIQELFSTTYFQLINTKGIDKEQDEDADFDGSGLQYARYRAVEYCKKYTDEKEKKAVQTAKALAGIYRTLMVKRLESSFFAFKHSLHSLLDATNGMIKMFEENKIIIAPEYNVRGMQADDMELDSIIDYIAEHGEEKDDFLFTREDFSDEFFPMLQHDSDLLTDLCKKWDAVEEDPKLDLFIDLINSELFRTEINHEGKLVVFSESVDTVHYLAEELKKRLQRTDILDVCSSDRKRKIVDIVENFDAKYKGEWLNKYNIIITSDVLAEGINLHRANVIVNYDSPWNATRLMQRIGRVNRIGSTADTIHNYMFYPSEAGDKKIFLKKNSLIKLQSFHSALGEDTRIFSREEIVHEFQLFNADVVDDVDTEQALREKVRDLYNGNRTLYHHIASLPTKSRCGRNKANINTTSNLKTPSTLVYLSSERKKGYYLVGERAEELTFLNAVSLFEAAVEEHPAEFMPYLDEHYTHVRKAMSKYNTEQQQTASVNTAPIGNKNQPKVRALAYLRERKKEIADTSVRQWVENIESLVNKGTYNHITRELDGLSKNKSRKPLPLNDFVARLEEWNNVYLASNVAKENEQNISSEIEFMLSETIVD